MMLSKSGKGSVGGGEAGEKAKTTPDEDGKWSERQTDDEEWSWFLHPRGGVTFFLKKMILGNL
jgi:hypothetical protein